MGIREHFAKAGRELAIDKLDWDKICGQWDALFTGARIDQNKPYPQLNLPKPINLQDLLEKQKVDRLLYIMPGTFGDVFLSTAVIDSIKKQYPSKDIYFAVSPQFKDILEGNPNIFKVLNYDGIFNNTPVMNTLFERVYTPYVETQMSTNWTQNGYGKHLVETYAAHCGVPVGELYMQVLEYRKPVAEEYIVMHTATGQESKNYLEYQKIANRINLPIVQVGGSTDPVIKGATDMRGKRIQETAGIISKAKLFIGGDSVCAHIAGYVETKCVMLYGATFPKLTAPYNASSTISIEPANRFGCDRPCHLGKCPKSPVGCINNIEVSEVVSVLVSNGIPIKDAPLSTISGYTTTLNPKKYYPWKESIKSMLAFCDEVVVVDGGSTDGTLEELQEWKKSESKLKVFKRKWSFNEPAMDGMMKAYARALCTKEFCWQQDCDEIVHESDYSKIRTLIDTLPSLAKVVTLPVLDLYGSTSTVRTDRGLYKARLSKNLPYITHGIPKFLRQTNDQNKIFCDHNLSDGCDYIHSQTFDPIDGQISFFNQQIFEAQQKNIPEFKTIMKEAYNKFPSVWHFSWHNLERRMNVDLEFWDDQWKRLSSQNSLPPENRFFPGVDRKDITPERMKERATFLKDKKLDGTLMDFITIDWLNVPEIIKPWLEK